MSVAFDVSTETGIQDSYVPSPRIPYWFEPQHLSPPPVMIAQVWPLPADIARTPLVIPSTSAGCDGGVPFPGPTRHAYGFPQHLTPPDCINAQV
jgi:hypothetical protein